MQRERRPLAHRFPRGGRWSHEEYLAAVLQRQIADREANGTSLRIAGAHFPAVKTLEDFNLDHQPSLRRDVLAHLATTTWIAKAENVIQVGPPGVGKTHLGIGLGIKACHAGYPVAFDTATGWGRRSRAERIRAHGARVLDAAVRNGAPADQDAWGSRSSFNTVASEMSERFAAVSSVRGPAAARCRRSASASAWSGPRSSPR